LATYFDSPSSLVFDANKEFRANVEHIIEDNKSRFPTPYDVMDNFQLQTFLKGSIASQADMAMVVEDHGTFYRASTCLTLDMAYTNARLLARPDRDWLQP
jgi:hypothetical protein